MIPIICNSTSIFNDDCLDHHELQFNQNIILMVHMSLLKSITIFSLQSTIVDQFLYFHPSRKD